MEGNVSGPTLFAGVIGRSSPALHDVPAPEPRLFAEVIGHCSPAARGGSDLWSGRPAGRAACGRSGWRAERVAGGVATSPLPDPATATELARVDGEGCTVFQQTLTNPAHSPPSWRGGRRPGWCLRRRRQATAQPTARQRKRQLHSVWAHAVTETPCSARPHCHTGKVTQVRAQTEPLTRQ